jgi:DNA-binding GntR family transcriptional regulator
VSQQTQAQGASAARAMPALRVPTVTEEVVRGIRAMIMGAEVRPGERLVEERLSERFGVSRPPIREALRVLERDGIVQSIPRKGFIVIPITAADVREIYELRWILERSAVIAAMPVKRHALLEPMRAAVARMSADRAQTDPEQMLEANSEFHAAMVSLAGNSRLTAAYSTLSKQLQLCMAMNLRFRRELYGEPGETVRRHQVLVELIEAGDLNALLSELDNHGDRSFMTQLDDLISP